MHATTASFIDYVRKRCILQCSNNIFAIIWPLLHTPSSELVTNNLLLHNLGIGTLPHFAVPCLFLMRLLHTVCFFSLVYLGLYGDRVIDIVPTHTFDPGKSHQRILNDNLPC